MDHESRSNQQSSGGRYREFDALSRASSQSGAQPPRMQGDPPPIDPYRDAPPPFDPGSDPRFAPPRQGDRPDGPPAFEPPPYEPPVEPMPGDPGWGEPHWEDEPPPPEQPYPEPPRDPAYPDPTPRGPDLPPAPPPSPPPPTSPRAPRVPAAPAGERPPASYEAPTFDPIFDEEETGAWPEEQWSGRGGDGGGDDGSRSSGGSSWGFEGDSGLLRVVGVIVGLAVVIAVLVLPPISILDDDGGSGDSGLGIQTTARNDVPPLPNGLVALSALYDLSVPAGVTGPVALTVRLQEQPTDQTNLGFYTFSEGQWTRLGAVSASAGNDTASGEVSLIPDNIAVLQRISAARGLAYLLEPGQSPDTAAPGAQIVSLAAATPALNGDADVLEFDGEALAAARSDGGGAQLYLGVTAESAVHAQAVNALLATPALIESHVAAIVSLAAVEDVAGVHLDYPAVDVTRRAALTSLVEQLATRLGADGRQLVVSVPVNPAATAAQAVDTGAYDWAALAAAAEALWLRAPRDGARFYADTEATLAAYRDAGLDLSTVWLITDRRSYERTPDGLVPLTQREALAIASAVRTRLDVGIAPGDAVSVAGTNIEQDAGNTGLHWDEAARSVAFTYSARGGPREVWIENDFSFAFRLEVAQRFGLGGVAVAAAEAADELPDIWGTLAAFVEEGRVDLELPYGPYLLPEWIVSDGVVEGGDDGVIIWRAPSQIGTYDLTLVVSDGAAFVGQQISLRVTEDGNQSEPAPTSVADPDPDPAPAETPEPIPEPILDPTPEPAPQPTPEPTPQPTTTVPDIPPGPAGNQ